jgi:hypothetical protein
LTSVLVLCATPVAFYFVSWFVDLWAKSYDLSWEQGLGKVALWALSVITVAGTALTVARVLEGAFWLGLIVALPAGVVLLWTLYDLNWRGVYAAALLGLLGALVLRSSESYVRGVLLCSMAGVLGVWLVSEVGEIRFRRYARMLERGCSCCGYKQRAVHELCAFGVLGEVQVRRYLARLAGQYDTPVREELSRCRPTSA